MSFCLSRSKSISVLMAMSVEHRAYAFPLVTIIQCHAHVHQYIRAIFMVSLQIFISKINNYHELLHSSGYKYQSLSEYRELLMQNLSSNTSTIIKIEAVRYHLYQCSKLRILLAQDILQENQLLMSITGFYEKNEQWIGRINVCGSLANAVCLQVYARKIIVCTLINH